MSNKAQSVLVQNITSVRGFKCWGAHTGIKSMRRDLMLLYSEKPCAAALTCTQNKVRAEPVKLTQKHLSNNEARMIVCNAGNANACTGEAGMQGAMAMAKTASEMMNISPEDVAIASTGLIGEPFPTEEIVEGIRENIPKMSRSAKAGSFAANAILTTDTFPKEGFLTFEIGDKQINMGGMAKGSGMIHPNMATMLAFIATDCDIDKNLLQEATSYCVDRSFNMITVDGDTSTNDMVVVLANGMAGNKKIESKSDPAFKIFRENLMDLMIHLAKLIVSDGEGASKFIEYQVTKARNYEIARRLVRAISDSTLVKTAMFGRDPNWGRIISACGNAGVNFNYKKVSLYLGSQENQVLVLDQGKSVEFDRNFMKKLLRESHIGVRLEVHTGSASAVGWGSDMTTDYVLFNSVYTT